MTCVEYSGYIQEDDDECCGFKTDLLNFTTSYATLDHS